MVKSPEMFNLVNKIVLLMRQRRTVDELQDSVVVNSLHRVLDAVINDSCTFVSTCTFIVLLIRSPPFSMPCH